MCFLPMPLLKLMVGIGALISTALSLGVLALTIYVNSEKSEILDNANKQYVNDFLIAMYIISIFFLMLSIGGIYGAITTKRKASKAGNCLLSTYSIGVIVFLIVFLATSIVFFAAPTSVFGDDCTHGSHTKLIEELSNLTSEADSVFCSDACPCYLNQTNKQSSLALWLTANNKVFDTDLTKSSLKYQDCMKNSTQEGNAILLASLEKFLNCGGWCESKNANYLKFTDINSCVTQECLDSKLFCYEEFKTFMISKGELLGVGCIIATLLCFVNVIMICCICAHPNNRGKKIKNFYSRMMD